MDAACDTWEPLNNLTNCEPVRGRHCCLRAGDRSLPSPTNTATADRHRRRATADPADRLHGRGGATLPPGLRWWAGLRSTGGPTMAGSAAPSLASALPAPSRPWWPTTGIRWRCVVRRTLSSTPPPTAPAGCFSPAPAAGVVLALQPRAARP